MDTQISIKNVTLFSLAFILFTAIGTLSHEYGHIAVANFLGYKTTLHYGSMNYDSDELNNELFRLYTDNKTAIENGEDFEERTEYRRVSRKTGYDYFFITLGGPLQTMLTGTIGLAILYWRRRKTAINGFQLVDWLAVFLSLFWLREVFNVVMSVGGELLSPDGHFFGGDERNLSKHLHLWEGAIPISLAIIGLTVSTIVIFKFIPPRYRRTFILSGLIGGSAGFVLWMYGVGPILLP